ncbi:alpha/beta fold hydrolase [Actinokineospora auranticolor]|uniref:Alpha-beta hydrolase superfamily lysophospholipase n=1 Tax=Actinokineospora auranticolor TaxID=155976 RepID=A0A2S6GNM3_9PSEU|nr:alpha/beta fold hydrolase [Actinokineospora auranticolor]PPK66828.1 alpha-beta hydrolase superfamily lysophospholipase [Actinokineospora auranticolor]
MTDGQAPTLVLLHGLAGSGEVWTGLDAARHWAGPVRAPDLPGHGTAAPLDRYTFGGLAARVAEGLDPAEPVVVLGHSLGGVVALALASGWFGVRVAAVGALGVKVSWTPEELAKGAALGAKPAKVFGTREEAAAWAGRLAGLPAGPVNGRDGGWRAAVDPRAFAVGRPDLPGLLAAARCPVLLAAGETDPMSPAEHLRALVADPVVLPGFGHNAHVESPEAVRPLLARLAALV